MATKAVSIDPVAPFAGAWIEMNAYIILSNDPRRSLRGSVD